MQRSLLYLLMLCLAVSLPQVLMAQAKEKGNVAAQADSLLRQGIAYNNKNDFAKAESSLQNAIAFCRKHKLEKTLGQSLHELAIVYTETANYEKAVDLGEEALDLLEKHDRETFAKCLMTLEVCSNESGVFIRAMSYANRAVEEFRKIKNDTLLELALWRQGEIYRDINTSLAIPMLKESMALARKLHKYEDFDNILCSLGHCHTVSYERTYDMRLAERYMLQALEASLQYDASDVNNNRIYYAKMCTANEKYTTAEYQLKIVQAEAAAANDTNMLSMTAFCLAEVYYGMKRYAAAYECLKKHEALEDVYFGTRKKSTSEKMAFNFKTERLAAKNKLLKQERKLREAKLEQESFRKNVKVGMSIGAAVFLLLVTVLLFNYLKKKNVLLSKKSDTLRQQLLLTQMSPRFIAASINNIKALIREGEPDTAAGYLSKFAKLTRQILENSTGELITLDEEIAMITNFLTVQRMLHHEGFQFSVHCDDALDAESIYIPPMLTQPLVDNAVRRIMQAGTGEKWVSVKFRLKYGKLVFEVSDTGGSLKPGEKKAILETGPVRITIERLGRASYPNGDRLMIGNGRNGEVTGVIAWFEVPYVQD